MKWITALLYILLYGEIDLDVSAKENDFQNNNNNNNSTVKQAFLNCRTRIISEITNGDNKGLFWCCFSVKRWLMFLEEDGLPPHAWKKRSEIFSLTLARNFTTWRLMPLRHSNGARSAKSKAWSFGFCN